ncbi:helix-turn-helix domain-containing protein [Halocynthiibacter styelae]|uniref:helix-turn-helix domain-containing protein n=1 Tax=Halocynthiibacter styelae TaxID=2761955 RepID=UPI003743E5FF
MLDNRPFTPETLAARWDCSAETIRAMIRDGKLNAFRVGRMMRIAQATVEQFECTTSGSDASKDALSSCGTTATENVAAIVLRHTTPRRQSAKPAT